MKRQLLPVMALAMSAPVLGVTNHELPASTDMSVHSPGHNGCAWWDVLQLCQAITAPADDMIDRIDGLTQDAKNAAKEVIDDLMNKLGSVMEKAEAAALKIMQHAKQDAEELIKSVTDAINGIVNNIISKLRTMIGKTVSEVKAALIAVIGDVSKLVNTIFDRLDNTLHQVEQTIYQTLCTVEGMEKHLERFVDDILHNSMAKTYSDCDCMHQAAAAWKDSCTASCTCKKSLFSHSYACPLCYLSSWELNDQDHKLFSALKCKTMKEVEAGVAANWTASKIVTELASIEELAYQEHCSHYSSSFADHFLNEALNLTKLISTWAPPSEVTMRALTVQVLSHAKAEVAASIDQQELLRMLQRQDKRLQQQDEVIAHQQRQLDRVLLHTLPTDHVHTINAHGQNIPNDCGTPFECWTKAMAALQTAEAMVKDAENRTNAAEEALEKATAGLKDELKLFHGNTCPDGWVESSLTKGYLLVGRPQNGTSGTQLNHALTKDEHSRVGPHSHDVSITDSGHSHGIDDPGHSHRQGAGHANSGYNGGGDWISSTGDWSTGTAATGTQESKFSLKSRTSI